MVVTNDDVLYKKLHILRSHGMTTLTWDRHHGHAWSYDVVELGYNYRIDEIRAAIGRVQLGKLTGNNEQRRHLVRCYRDHLQRLPEILIPFNDHSGVSAAHLMPILLPRGLDRVRFMEGMKSQGVQTSIHYPPIHSFSAYQLPNAQHRRSLPVTEDVCHREVTLPLYSNMTDEDVAIVCQAVASSL